MGDPSNPYGRSDGNGSFNSVLCVGPFDEAITEVRSSDGRMVSYSYAFFESGAAIYSTLVGVNYPDGSLAQYSYSLAQPENFGAWPRPLLGSAYDPMLKGAAARMGYEYRAGGVVGFIKKEFHPDSGVVFSELVTSPTAPHRRVLDPNTGREETYELTDNQMTAYTTGVAGDPPQSVVYAPAQGWIQQESDGRGTWTSYSRDLGFGKSTAVTTALGTPRQAVMTRAYTDPNFPFYLASETDYNGGVTTFVRDPLTQRVVRKNYPAPDPTPQDPNPEPVFEEFAYNALGLVTSHRRKDGGTESFEYFEEGDDLGHPTLVKAWLDGQRRRWEYGYDAWHRRTSVKDPRGHTTTYEYAYQDRVTRTVHPDGTWREMTYDTFGNRTSLIDETNAVWTWDYDAQNRLIASSVPGAIGQGARTTTYQYGDGSTGSGSSCSCSTVAEPTLITLPSGRQTRICYDLRWRKVSETVGYGTADAATTFYSWDDHLLKTVTDPRGKVTTHSYDERGRRKETINPLGSVAGKWQFTYDANGNLLTTVRPSGFLFTENAYDKLNRLIQTWDPKRQTVSYAYDAGGRRKLLRDPRNHDYTFEYDKNGKMTRFVYPGGSYEQWTYDEAGNKATYRTRGNVLATYVYNNRNWQTAENWTDGVTPSVSRTFDEAGRPLTVVNVNSTITYTYHPGGELWTETQDVTGAGGARTLTYAFDVDGRRSCLTYPSGLVLDYAYTARGQLETIRTGSQPPIVSYAYDPAGNRLLKSLENGTWTEYAHDDLNRVTKIDHRSGSGSGTSFSRMDYGYNAVHSRTWVKRDNTGRGDVFAYDEADQLVDAKFDALNPDTTPSGWTSREEFQYDSAGNRQLYSYTIGEVLFESNVYATADALNQYPSVNSQNFTYNNSGSMIWDPLTGVSATYDAKESPLSMTNTGNSPVLIADKRDGKNRVVARTHNGITTYFSWDGWSQTEEMTFSDGVKLQVNGARLDELIAKRRNGGVTDFFHQDAIQSTMVLTDNNAAVVERYRYRAFGQATILDAAGATVRASSGYGNRSTFAGREALPAANILDYRNRAGNATVGRWMQADPIRFMSGDYNLFRYVGNRPNTLTDPMGLAACSIQIDIGHYRSSNKPKYDSRRGDKSGIRYGYVGCGSNALNDGQNAQGNGVAGMPRNCSHTYPGDVGKEAGKALGLSPDDFTDASFNEGYPSVAAQTFDALEAAREQARAMLDKPPDCCTSVEINLMCGPQHGDNWAEYMLIHWQQDWSTICGHKETITQ